jgi:cytochrome c-type biogenesis protein CcmH/NrfG
MRVLATRLMGQKAAGQVQSVSAIFGQLSNQARLQAEKSPHFRVGMWPILSESQPEIAMGLGALLGYILERWPSIRVYRLFAKINEDGTDFAWTIQKSQFTVDEWELEGLDENAAIWGEYTQSDGYVSLTLEVETDFADDTTALYKNTWEAESFSQLIIKLPQIADEIADYLGAGLASPLRPLYDVTNVIWDTSALENVTKLIFFWELNIYLALAGKAWSEQEIAADFQKLLEGGTKLSNGVGNWVTSNAAVRLLSGLYRPLFDFFSEQVINLDAAYLSSPEVAVAIATSLFRVGEGISAFYILEKAVEGNPQSAPVWLALAEVYWLGGETGAALNAYQSAIQSRVSSTLLYTRYADLLLAFDANNVLLNPGTQRVSASGRSFTEQYLLIDPQLVTQDQLLHEAVAAYFEALKLDPENSEIRTHLVLNLLDLEDERLWAEFGQLVQLDLLGNHIRNVIEGMYELDDLSAGVQILVDAVGRYPDRIALRVNLALIYLHGDNNDAALTELEKARNLAKDDKQLMADIDRLTLVAQDPNFEYQLGEITDSINAGSELSEEDIEFLEQAIEDAPSFVDLYILLANAFLRFDEVADALDVLLDGQKILPDNPQLAAHLARVLWRAGEHRLAFECLNQALSKNKNYVPLLALTGQFLFEDGQDTEARAFLGRAEALDPQDLVLRDVRIAIAKSERF